MENGEMVWSIRMFKRPPADNSAWILQTFAEFWSPYLNKQGPGRAIYLNAEPGRTRRVGNANYQGRAYLDGGKPMDRGIIFLPRLGPSEGNKKT